MSKRLVFWFVVLLVLFVVFIWWLLPTIQPMLSYG